MQRGDQESMSERGQKGGETPMHGQSVSASDIAMYLKGVSFPTDKQRIIQMVKTNGAPDNVVNMMNRLPDRQYTAPTEIEQEFNRMK